MRFRNQYGVVIPSVPRPPPSNGDALRDLHNQLGLTISSETCRNGTGERMQVAYVGDVLFMIAAG